MIQILKLRFEQDWMRRKVAIRYIGQIVRRGLRRVETFQDNLLRFIKARISNALIAIIRDSNITNRGVGRADSMNDV